MNGQTSGIVGTFAGHLWLMSTYRDSILTSLIERYNTAVDQLLDHTLSDGDHRQLQADVREMTAALSREQLCNCCTNPRHIRLACEKHRKGRE
jgi:hypothetical protein